MNKKYLFTTLLLLPFCYAFSAQDSIKNENGWKYAINTNLTLTLNNYSDNWDGSEVSSFAWGWKLDGFAEKTLTPWFKNVNTLKLAFGQTALQKKVVHIDSTEGKEWDSMKKSSDLVDFEVAGRFTLKSFVDPFISARLVSQFGDLRDSRKTYFLNPAVITESFGAIRDIVKNSNVDWTARIGGAVRQSVERNSTIRKSNVDKVVNDGGVEFITDLKASSKDNRIAYNTQFKLFEAIIIPEEIDTDQKRAPDISWENTLNVSLLKFVMLNFYFQLLYDKEIDTSVRFRQTAGLALTYNIKSAE